MSRIVLPAEWAPQSAVMLTWPRADGDFARWHDAVERNFIDLARAVSRHAHLHVNVAEQADGLRRKLLAAGVSGARLRIYQLPNDDVWARDHGPITVFRDGKRVHLDFRFNGWGGKFPATHDDALTGRLAALGAFADPVEPVDFVLEGGAIDSDGQGSLLTTARCLLAPTRNPGHDRLGIETRLRETLGVARVLWLEHGELIGDDTDGHIDTLARFCDACTIAYQACEDARDPHFAELAAMRAELEALRTRDGAPYRLIPLPLPAPILDADGRRLPAGYANFLIVNDAVLVPVYGDAADRVALDRLRSAFPNRELLPIDCRALIHQYGSLHCVTMQIPAAPE
ncbi:MAG: agmatine deiminase family protein [Sinobacteraceae bacterium]|nr:agmatine deiminase family protein [Nevskiaceae bacterium]